MTVMHSTALTNVKSLLEINLLRPNFREVEGHIGLLIEILQP